MSKGESEWNDLRETVKQSMWEGQGNRPCGKTQTIINQLPNACAISHPCPLYLWTRRLALLKDSSGKDPSCLITV